MIKVGEVARRIGRCHETVRNYERTGELVPDKVSERGTRYYKEETVEAFLRRRNGNEKEEN